VNLRNPRLQNDSIASMTQDLSFDWSDSRYQDSMISSPSSTVDMQNQQRACYAMEHRDMNDANVKLLLRTLSSAGGRSSLQSCPEDFYCSSSTSPGPPPTHRGTFSQIYPTINVSNFSETSLANSSSTSDMNLQALDLLHSARFGGSICQSLQDHLGLSRNGLSYDFDYMKQSIQGPILNSNNVSIYSPLKGTSQLYILHASFSLMN
jgi:hypothetical protein